MMDTSCGAKFQSALQSFRMRPRLSRWLVHVLDVTKLPIRYKLRRALTGSE